MKLINKVIPPPVPPPSIVYTLELTAQEMSAIFAALSDSSSEKTQEIIFSNWIGTIQVPKDEAWTLYKEFKKLLTEEN